MKKQNCLIDFEKFISDNFDSSRATIDEIFRTNVLALEYMVREVETQIAGLVVILDMSGLALNHAKFFTPYYAKKTVQLVQETFPLRFKGFHIVNEPFYFDAIMAVLKPFLKEKMKKRVLVLNNASMTLKIFRKSKQENRKILKIHLPKCFLVKLIFKTIIGTNETERLAINM